MKQGLNLKLIRQKRKNRCATLQEMAELMGLRNASTYMKYEKGDYSFKAEHLPLLAKAFGCSIQDLFFDLDLANTASNAVQATDSDEDEAV